MKKIIFIFVLILTSLIVNAEVSTNWTNGGIEPKSGADGTIDFTTYGGYDVLSQTGAISNNRYMYFKVSQDFADLFKYPESDATVEFTLFDDTAGEFFIQYCTQDNPYETVSTKVTLTGLKQWTNVSFYLSFPVFNHAENLGTDFRTAREADGSPNLIIREVKVIQNQLNEPATTIPAATNVFTFQADKNNLPVQPVDNDLAQLPGATNILIGNMHSAWSPGNLYEYLFNATSNGGYGVGYADGKVLFADNQLNTSKTVFNAPTTINEIRVFGGGHGDGRCFVNCKIYFSKDGDIYNRFIVPGTTNLMIGTGNGDDINNYTANINNAMARVYCTDGTPLAENIRYIKLVFRPASTLSSIMELYPSSDAILSPVVREIDIIGTTEPSKATSSKSFALTNHIISTSFFHWYTKNGGQLSGSWLPRDGRASWSGESGWWKTQIKQVMLAGIDVLYVHLIPAFEQQRINLFQALSEMRYDGYDVPKVAPFLDPIITWTGQPKYSLANAANRQKIVDQYIRFFNQYYSVNTDEYADDYIDVIDNRVALDVWHLGNNFTSISSFQRRDMEDPLAAEFGAEHPVFSNGIYMITTESGNTFSFADEQVRQFQSQDYSYITDYNGIKSDQLKPGYWDQNIRNPGTCFKRDGGVNYSNSWVTYPDALTVKRVYIESWNEFDEGSGIFAANPIDIYRIPSNTSTDDWSKTDDSLEYIKTTYRGARTFKRFEIGSKNSEIIWQNMPTNMFIGETNYCQVYVRNTGFDLWTSNDLYSFGQVDSDTENFGPGRYYFNDNENEVDLYLGIFKGRPVKFDVKVIAPAISGIYETHWRMLQEGVVWFGEEITNTIYVYPIPEPFYNAGILFIIYYLMFIKQRKLVFS
ncbi:MAG: hypothetical protein DRI44_04055 [Chlamydiae bacterium]|nr:MAG: hypothetical protein DRI44_04055 [Chlamydiota bacterium]